MSRLFAVWALLLCGPLMASSYFAAARNVECGGGRVTLAKTWRCLLEQGFESIPQTWEVKNFEDNLKLETVNQAHGGAAALWLTHVKQVDTAWELIAPPVSVEGLTTMRLRLWLRTNRSLTNTNPHKDSYFSCVEFRGADGTVVGSLPISWGGLNETWHEVEATAPVPAGAVVAVLRMGWDSPNIGPGEYVALDDLQLLGQGKQPTFESEGEWTSGPVAIHGATAVTVDWQASTPAQTSIRVRLEGQAMGGSTWQAIGTPLVKSGQKLPLPADVAQVRYVVGLTTAAPALSPTVRSVTLTAGKQIVRHDQFQGVDVAAPQLADYGPTRAAASPAALRFRLADAGVGVAPESLRTWLDGAPVTFAPQADGSYSYRPPQPLAPPSLGPGFTGWRTGNHTNALLITRVEGRPGGAAQAFRVTRPAGPIDTAFALTSPQVGVVAGSDYTLAFWYRSSLALTQVSGYNGGLRWLDAEGKPVGDPTPITYGPQSADWREVRLTARAPAGAAAVVIVLGWDTPNLADRQFVEFADPTLDGPRPPTNPGPNMHQVRVVAQDHAGNALDQTWFLLIKDLPAQSRVTVRDDGVTLVDGKPFFPIGIYSVSKRPANNNSYDDAFKELRGAGFNLAHTYASARGADFAEFYAAAARNGMKLWVAPETGNNNPDATGAVMTVARECNEDALLAWYLADDTSGHIGPEELRGVHQAIMEADPYHITVQADGIGGVNDQRYVKYINSTTGFLPEIYPIRQKTGNHVADVIRSMENVQAGWKAAGRVTPVWAIIQDFEGWGWQRFPTNEEERCMVYLALIHGAQGMTWYTYAYRDDKHGAPWDPKIWAYLKGIATELSSLSDFYTARAPQERPRGKVVKGPEKGDLDYPSLNLRLMTHGGQWVLLAANSAGQPISAQIKVPGLKGEAEVLFEGRKVTTQAGQITDDFAPLAVHVYRW